MNQLFFLIVISLFVTKSFSMDIEKIDIETRTTHTESSNYLEEKILDQNFFKEIEEKSKNSNLYEMAYELETIGQQALLQKNFTEAAHFYLASLQVVFNNYDLNCFLKRIGFNIISLPDLYKNNDYSELEYQANQLEMLLEKINDYNK